jgi:uncharacterized membrane protein YphA (DoxX/SURF4 family)
MPFVNEPEDPADTTKLTSVEEVPDKQVVPPPPWLTFMSWGVVGGIMVVAILFICGLITRMASWAF